MRDRLRQGREPIVRDRNRRAARLRQSEAEPQAATAIERRRPSAQPAGRSGRAGRPRRSVNERDAVVAVYEPTAAGDHAARAAAAERHGSSSPPRCAPAGRRRAESRRTRQRRGASSEDARTRPGVPAWRAAKAGAEPAPDATPGVRIGRVISVAGPLVWGMIEERPPAPWRSARWCACKARPRAPSGVITTLKNDGRRGGEDDRRLIEIRLLGEILNAGSHRWRFQRGVSSHPALDSAIHAASREELCAIYARPEAPTVRLGTLKHASDLPAFAITDNLLGKHFAVLGTTGAGKSCAVTVILRAILDAHPYGHIIMLDPHNEYRCGFASAPSCSIRAT